MEIISAHSKAIFGHKDSPLMTALTALQLEEIGRKKSSLPIKTIEIKESWCFKIAMLKFLNVSNKFHTQLS